MAAVVPLPGVVEKEIELLREAVLLPLVLRVLEESGREMRESSYAFKPLFLGAAKAMHQRVRDDLAATRKQLAVRGLRLTGEERLPAHNEYHYVCRGQRSSFTARRDVIKQLVRERIDRYTTEMFGGDLDA